MRCSLDNTLVLTLAWVMALACLPGCSPKEVRPVDLFPEDACSHCRMAVSDHRFASEMITDQSEVFKFDDLGCLQAFRETHAGLKAAAIYLKDYDTGDWVVYEKAVIVETDVDTPMGSGMVAFSDSARAVGFRSQHPVKTRASTEN